MPEYILFNKITGKTFRPFSSSANITPRGYSSILERAIVDFGADNAFGHVAQKLKEHYGIDLPSSAATRITEKNALLAHAYEEECLKSSEDSTVSADIVITEIDGSMVPTVKTSTLNEGEIITDKRKHKTLEWREAKLCMAHPLGSAAPKFSGTFGDPIDAGEKLYLIAKQAGFNTSSKVHAVGDGAKWIAEQVKNQFGKQGDYLIDFYHLCEYLSAAAKVIAPNSSSKWLDEQKQYMKDNEKNKVIMNLLPYIELPEIPDKDAPVRACHRYITNRPNQFKYKEAIANELPIGSGEIESAHRYVIQKRLKLPGAWWQIDNAQNMLSLRIMRHNQRWEAYWNKVIKQAA